MLGHCATRSQWHDIVTHLQRRASRVSHGGRRPKSVPLLAAARGSSQRPPATARGLGVAGCPHWSMPCGVALCRPRCALLSLPPSNPAPAHSPSTLACSVPRVAVMQCLDCLEPALCKPFTIAGPNRLALGKEQHRRSVQPVAKRPIQIAPLMATMHARTIRSIFRCGRRRQSARITRAGALLMPASPMVSDWRCGRAASSSTSCSDKARSGLICMSCSSGGQQANCTIGEPARPPCY